MLLSKDRIGGLLLLVFCAGYGLVSQDIKLLPFQEQTAFHARTMPEALTILGVILAIILLIRPGSDDPPEVRGLHWGRIALICLVMIAYGFGVRPLGFIVSTVLFLVAGMLILGERRWSVMLGSSVPLVVAFWTLMSKGLDVYVAPLPKFLTGG